MLKGRRAAGSVGAFTWLTEKIPLGFVSLYIAKQYKSAYQIMWPIALEMNNKYNLGLHFRKGAQEIETPSGGILRLGGCDDMSEAQKYRGIKIYRCFIDEAASFPTDQLRELIEGILSPTLADVLGDLGLGGTPGYDPAGYFYEKTDGANPWPTFRFNCLSNHHINGAKAIEREMKKHNFGPEHPTLLREWYGKWIKDMAAIIYPYDPLRNTTHEPFKEGYTTISCDVGWHQPCGFTVMRSNFPQSNEIHILKSFRMPQLTVGKIAATLQQLMKTYAPHGNCKIFVDTAGGSKNISETLKEEHGLPCFPAYKPDKKTRIESFRSGLIAGTIKLVGQECRDLTEEWSALVWDPDRKTHKDGCQDDASDSVLYAFKGHRQWSMEDLEEDRPGTAAFAKKKDDEEQDRAEREAMKNRRRSY